MFPSQSDLWILTDTGLVIYERVKNPQVDAQLFGGLFSALEIMAKQIDQAGISSLSIGNMTIHLKQKNRLIFIATFYAKLKSKEINQAMESIINDFILMFPPSFFQNWKGNLNLFEKFNEKLESNQINQYAVEKLMSIW
jgi:hypothetical protein